ncbi:MAG: rod shape-determining protein MreD [Lachnospiraceae bacterium]|nr:rod shape-determining protein MreD [Lachnospiraceae bacterium]
MKKVITAVLLILISFVLQCTVFRALAVQGIVPNVLIILTACSGFMQGDRYGVFVGFFCGLLMDLFFFEIIGFYSLLYMYIGYMNGLFHNIFYPDDIKLPLIMITLSDLLYSMVVYVLLFLLRSRFDFGYYLLNIILPELVYTILVAVIVYPLLLLIMDLFRRAEKKEE